MPKITSKDEWNSEIPSGSLHDLGNECQMLISGLLQSSLISAQNFSIVDQIVHEVRQQVESGKEQYSDLQIAAFVACGLERRGILTAWQAQQCLQGNAELLCVHNHVLIHPLATGGMGGIYIAKHRTLGQERAVKIPREVQEETVKKRMLQECIVIAYLSERDREHFICAHDVESDAQHGLYFIVELLQGRTLEQVVREQGRLEEEEILKILLELARALSVTERAGVVHRDIKPSNVMLTSDNRVVLVDFGLCKVLEKAENAPLREKVRRAHAMSEDSSSIAMTQEGQTAGTPGFMAPEQYKNFGDVDSRADIFSLGATTYFLAAGTRPYPELHGTKKIEQAFCEHGLPALPGDCSSVFQTIYGAMSSPEREQRASPSELLRTIQDQRPELFLEAITASARRTPRRADENVRWGEAFRTGKMLPSRKEFVRYLVGAALVLPPLITGMYVASEHLRPRRRSDLIKELRKLGYKSSVLKIEDVIIDLADETTVFQMPTESEHLLLVTAVPLMLERKNKETGEVEELIEEQITVPIVYGKGKCFVDVPSIGMMIVDFQRRNEIFRKFKEGGYDRQWVNGTPSTLPIAGNDLSSGLGPSVASLCHDLRLSLYPPSAPYSKKLHADVQQVFSDFESGDFPKAYEKYRH